MPTRSVEAQPVAIRVDGLRPRERITLTLRSTDSTGARFAAHANFAASASGVADLEHARALPGSSYPGVWPMGLLTSMSSSKPFAYYQWGDGPQVFHLTASAGGQTIATSSFTRRFTRTRPKTVRTTVAKDGFLGTFYVPRGAVHRPAVLSFGGSEGGPGSSWEAEQLAADGLPTLEIGYFHAPTLPDELVNIPLEYFRNALKWLEKRPEVDAGRISLFTSSYGSEAALLLGVHYPALVHRIVALTPSAVVTCGIRGADRRATNPVKACLGSPWTLHGKPVPYSKLLNNATPWDVPQAIIPVARIKAPVFVSCGGNDTIWNSCAYAHAIVRRRGGERTILRDYPNAGHHSNGAFFEYEPGALAHDLFVPATERAREDLTPRVLEFLQGR